ncbi:MAG: phosphatidate cytidylyltransferase [Spirochaetaceae bacterium]|nr:phosphatidate cytidylyltransferase [Spirochaetaceae bacterium]
MGTALVALPALFAVIFLLPQKNHLAFNCVIIIFATLSAFEFAGILRKKEIDINNAEAFVFGMLPALMLTLHVSFDWPLYGVLIAVFFCGGYSLISCALTGATRLERAALRLAGNFAVILYPGAFLACAILISKLPFATVLIGVFLGTVFANDIAAWFLGMLFGRGNKGIIVASPNKSIAGFAGGFAGAMAAGVGASVVWPEVFTAVKFSAVNSGIILGLTTACAATLGDLAESAFKRSAGVKDSGILIPGRGGVLDCIDSISLAAPVFCFVYHLLFLSA